MQSIPPLPALSAASTVGLSPCSLRATLLIIGALTALTALGLILHGPIPQWPEFFAFADRRTLIGVPNAGDVLSNLPFLAFGLWALVLAWRSRPGQHGYATAFERGNALLLAGALIATSAGSSYFHHQPDPHSLFWDRLPLAVLFMALFTQLIAERLGVAIARRLLPLLLGMAVGSVLAWYLDDPATGDLRAYVFVQFFPMLAVPVLVALRRSAYAGGNAAWCGVIACYGIAKILELGDARCFALTSGLISGHTLKHLVAALALGCLLVHVARRKMPSAAS